MQAHPFLVDAVDLLSSSPLFTGLVFAVPVFVLWQRAGLRRPDAQRLIITIALATIVGAMVSVLLQQFFRWPPPSTAAATASVYADRFHYNENPNSFPSDSTMLYSTVAFGLAVWSRSLAASLLAWLLLFVAPSRVFVGGHYPSDIFAGLLVGLFASWVSQYITRNSRLFEWLSVSSSPILFAIFFVWLFELGAGFTDVRQVANTLWHIRRHL